MLPQRACDAAMQVEYKLHNGSLRARSKAALPPSIPRRAGPRQLASGYIGFFPFIAFFAVIVGLYFLFL